MAASVILAVSSIHAGCGNSPLPPGEPIEHGATAFQKRDDAILDRDNTSGTGGGWIGHAEDDDHIAVVINSDHVEPRYGPRAYSSRAAATWSGSLAKFAAMRRTSSLVSSFALIVALPHPRSRNSRAPARWHRGR
jgi:hypothetical protein